MCIRDRPVSYVQYGSNNVSLGTSPPALEFDRVRKRYAASWRRSVLKNKGPGLFKDKENRLKYWGKGKCYENKSLNFNR